MKAFMCALVIASSIPIELCYSMQEKGKSIITNIVAQQFRLGTLKRTLDENFFIIPISEEESTELPESAIVEILITPNLNKKLTFSENISFKMFQMNGDLPKSSYDMSDYAIKQLIALQNTLQGWQERKDTLTGFMNSGKAIANINLTIKYFSEFRDLILEERKVQNKDIDTIMLEYITELKENRKRYIASLRQDKKILNATECPIHLKELLEYKKRPVIPKIPILTSDTKENPVHPAQPKSSLARFVCSSDTLD